eukprot:scaffold16469_cov26-Prasinocladus_malaysianus.AAC.1
MFEHPHERFHPEVRAVVDVESHPGLPGVDQRPSRGARQGGQLVLEGVPPGRPRAQQRPAAV